MAGSELFLAFGCQGDFIYSSLAIRILPSDKTQMQKALAAGEGSISLAKAKTRAQKEYDAFKKLPKDQVPIDPETEEPKKMLSPEEEMKAVLQLPGEFVFEVSQVEIMRVLAPMDESQQADMIISFWANLDMPKKNDKTSMEKRRGYYKRVGYHRLRFRDILSHEEFKTKDPWWVPGLPMAHLPSYFSGPTRERAAVD